jgi:hypothetical protein
MSLIALRSGSPADAIEPLDEGLRLSREHGLGSVVGNLVDAVAAIAVQRNEPELAAVLLGATAEDSRTAGIVEDELRAAAVAAAKSALGERGYAEFAASGAALDMTGAAARAQDWLDSQL